jgi:hypothetical protein
MREYRKETKHFLDYSQSRDSLKGKTDEINSVGFTDFIASKRLAKMRKYLIVMLCK